MSCVITVMTPLPQAPPPYLHQPREVLQHALHGQLQQVVVPQVESSQVDSGEHAGGERAQQIGVEEQQLEGRHGVQGPGVHLVDLVVLKVEVPEEGEEGAESGFLCTNKGSKWFFKRPCGST